MASVVKRGKSWHVVYTYTDRDGKKKQKWETFHSAREAEKRKVEVEYTIVNHTFTPPVHQTLAAFLDDFCELYGKRHWSNGTYVLNRGLMDNYIIPILGKMELCDLTPKTIDEFVRVLEQTHSVASGRNRKQDERLSDDRISTILGLLRSALNQAYKWELISKNPFDHVDIQKPKSAERKILTPDQIATALRQCTDERLFYAINLSFACSMRIGEVLGLTWDCVHISDEEIAADNAYVYVNKQMSRVRLDALGFTDGKDIYKRFPNRPNDTTVLTLKRPKTESSKRRIWLPKTLAKMLRRLYDEQLQRKDILGDAYKDNNLVVCNNDGSPCGPAYMTKLFNKFIKKTGLPNVTFHSIRHSSSTYKLQLSNGDIKSIQGDTGHATSSILIDTYAHIMDENRKINAKKFDDAFYSASPPHEKASERNDDSDLNWIIKRLSESPELLRKLSDLIR